MKIYHLTAFWDDDAKVWTTAKSDIPGLIVEAESFEEFVALAEDLAPELAAENLPVIVDKCRLIIEVIE